MIVEKSKKKQKRIEIDLSGPDGNAFVLLSYAKRWCKDLGMDYEPLRRELTTCDYSHLLNTLDKHFGRYVIFYK